MKLLITQCFTVLHTKMFGVIDDEYIQCARGSIMNYQHSSSVSIRNSFVISRLFSRVLESICEL